MIGRSRTLVCEGNFGRLFEVTLEGRFVWEYVNPYFAPPVVPRDAPPQNLVFRAYRYSSAHIARAAVPQARRRARPRPGPIDPARDARNS